MPKKHLTIHTGQSCGPCALCGHTSPASKPYYVQPICWTEDIRKRVEERSTETLKDTSCICQACNKDIIRNINAENYIPRWSSSSTPQCIVSKCSNTSRNANIIKTAMATTGEVETLLQCSLKTGIEYVTLCTSHYKELHRTLRGDIYDIYDKCSSCNITLKHTIDKVRHPSNATAINKYEVLKCLTMMRANYATNAIQFS